MHSPPRSTSWSRASSGRRGASVASTLGLLGLLAALSGASCPRGGAAPRELTLVVTAGLQGQLLPFSDPRRTAGGVARLATVLERVRGESGSVVWADAGDALFGSTDLPPELLPQAERRARAIAEAYTLLGNDAFAIGERDLLRGPEFVRKTGLRGLLDAGRGPEGLPQATVVDAPGVRLALLAAGARSSGLLAEQAAQARSAGAGLVVALVHATAEQTASLVDRLPEGAIDAAIAGHPTGDGVPDDARVPGRVPVFRLPGSGRAVLRLDFSLAQGAPRGFVVVASDEERRQALARVEAQLRQRDAEIDGPIQAAQVAAVQQRLEELRRSPRVPAGQSSVAWQLVRLDPDVPEAPLVGSLLERYRAEVGRLNSLPQDGRSCQAVRVGQPTLVGADRCRECHPAASAAWADSAHARAMQALRRLGRSLDQDCARCHLTGLYAPGGVCALPSPEGREGVQCEACHRPGSAHAETPGRRMLGVDEQSCRGCHTPDHAPGFSYARDRSRVVVPGHGAR